jgi:peroxiredoxin
MPIFHFDIADGVRLEDPVGLDCRNESDARRTAELFARQIAVDLDDGNLDDGNEARSVVVVDEAGSEIFQTPVKA